MHASKRLKHTTGTRNAALRPRKHFRTNSKMLGAQFRVILIVGRLYLFGTQRYIMKRFPFVVVYRVAADGIEVVAVAHGSRKPGYWKNRLASD